MGDVAFSSITNEQTQTNCLLLLNFECSLNPFFQIISNQCLFHSVSHSLEKDKGAGQKKALFMRKPYPKRALFFKHGLNEGFYAHSWNSLGQTLFHPC